MKKFLLFSCIIGFAIILLSCAGEKKEVLFQIPLDCKVKDCSVVFGKNGEHFSFVKENPEGEAVIFDGKTGENYLSIEVLTLSPDGNHCAYIANDGKKEYIIKDGEEIATYPYKTVVRSDAEGKTIQFFSNGNLIYTKREAKKMKKVMKDGKPIDSSPYSAKPRVSRDGNHLLYWIVDGTGDYLVLDGKKNKIKGFPLYHDISGDGMHYGAVLEISKTKNSVMIDGEKIIELDAKDPVIDFYLSEKGEHFIALQKDLSANEIKVKYDGSIVAVVNKVFLSSIAFSQDDLHYAFTMLKTPQATSKIVLDGKEITSFDTDYSNVNECFGSGRKLVFSPSGTNLLYMAGSGTNQILALDQKAQIRFDLYNTVVFSHYFSGEKEISCLCLDKVNKQLQRVTKTLMQ
jgi:hypothetical protein